MERHQQSGDGKFARGIGEQLQRLRMPDICHRHLDLLRLETFNVAAKTPMNRVSDHYLGGEPKELSIGHVSGPSFSSDMSNVQSLRA